MTLRQRRLCYDLACVFLPTSSHRVRGWANPVSPAPCGRARPSILSGAGGWGKPVSPCPSSRAYVHVRRSCAWRTTPRCTCPGSAGVPPASRLRGHGDRPFPAPPPLGAGTRLLPPAGGGWEGGCTRRTMVTAALHAAPPHNAAMNIRLFLGWLCPPKPSHRVEGWGTPVSPCPCGRGCGGTRFPHTPRRGRMFTLGGVRPGNLRAGEAGAGGVGAGKTPPNAGPPPGRGCAPQTLPPGGGMGKPGFPMPLRAGVWGNRVPP